MKAFEFIFDSICSSSFVIQSKTPNIVITNKNYRINGLTEFYKL